MLEQENPFLSAENFFVEGVFRQIIEGAMDAIICIDYQNRIIFINNAAGKLFGYEIVELRNKHIEMLIPERFRKNHSAHIRHFAENRHTQRTIGKLGEIYGLKKDNEEFPIEASISHIQDSNIFVVIIRDRTEQKKREMLLSTAVESAPNGIIMVDKQGKIVLVNSELEKLFGYSKDELIDDNLQKLIPDCHRSAHGNYVHDFFGSPTNRQMGVGRKLFGQHRDGHEIPIEIVLNPIVMDQKEFVIAAIIDISARLELEATQQQLDVAKELVNFKDRFLAIASHELRTPLAVIVGWCGILEDWDTVDANQQQEAISAIMRSASLQVRLINDLLDISRIVSGKIVITCDYIKIQEVINEVLQDIYIVAEEKRINLVYSLTVMRSGFIWGDKERVKQIIYILLSNAIKFTPVGGTVKICLEHKDSSIRIIVEDNGIGISSDFLPHIFEFFYHQNYSSGSEQKGMGIGLAIAQHLVGLHNGVIEVESEGVKKGSKFTVTLPIVGVGKKNLTTTKSQSLPGMIIKEPDTAEIQKIPSRILIVEDHEDTRKMLIVALSELNAEIEVCSNTADASKVLIGFRPEIIICDINLPGENGYDFIRRVRSQGVMIAAIALTAQARPEDRELAYAAGFNLHLSKPITPQNLIRTIKEFLKK